LFVGTLRTGRRLLADGLCNRVVCADWKGALDGHPDARAALRDVDAHIIELPPMQSKGPGNVLTQVRSLSAVLDGLEATDHVLKSRPDCHLSETLLRRILEPGRAQKYAIAPDNPRVFAERIWVPWFHTSRIMHLSDEAFYGRVEDLWKLQRHETRFDEEFGPPLSQVHSRRFAPPFFEHYPELVAYYTGFAQVIPARRGLVDVPRLLAAIACEIPNYRYLLYGVVVETGLEQRSFIQLLALYYTLLARYFVIDSGQPGVDFLVRRGPAEHERTHGHDLRSDLLRSGDPCVRCYGDEWLAMDFVQQDGLHSAMLRARKEVEGSHERKDGRVAINAGLWLGDPDVDGVTRLVIRPVANGYDGDPVVLAEGTWAPVNSQNTAVARRAVPCYFFPRMPSIIGGRKIDRYADILSGFFLQACAKAMKESLAIGGPVVRHRRNDHDVFADVDQELPMIRLLEDLSSWITSVKPTSTSYRDLYLELAALLDDECERWRSPPWSPSLRAYCHELCYLMRIWLRSVDRLA